jgi:uncharacterized protein
MYVLSIDCIGVNSKLVLAFLHNLEENLDKPLYNYFDLFVGSSDGGLIASCIGHKRMKIKEIHDKLYNNTKKIYNHKNFLDKFFSVFKQSSKYQDKSKFIEDIFGKDTSFYNNQKCVAITAYDITNHEPILFKSWDRRHYNLSKAVNACSSFPGYFPSVEYKPFNWAVDGSVVSKNTSMIAYIEALKLWGEYIPIKVLSIGKSSNKKNSIKRESENWDSQDWINYGDFFNLLLDGNVLHTTESTEDLSKLNGHEFLRIQDEINNYPIDDVSNLKNLEIAGHELWDYYKDKTMNFLNSTLI